jgi:two-component system, NtrC family, response regulator GlrR
MAQKETVLVIDDEPSVADALEVILSDSGYQVAVATSGREALEKLGKRRLDLAITDVRLSDMSGLDVLRRIHPNMPVIIITAHYTLELAAELLSLGAAGVLAKPFSPSDLLGMIETASGRV